jgi:hypothetical protein
LFTKKHPNNEDAVRKFPLSFKKMVKAPKHLFLFLLLSLFTQTGGIVWLLFLPISAYVKRRLGNAWKTNLLRSGAFLLFYLAIHVFLVPPLAKWQCGRVPLPVFGHPYLKPHLALYYCLLNHHYVRPGVKASLEEAAEKLADKFPGTKLYYLDANFPFWEGYPLEPHFTHRHGTTVDIALHWSKAGGPIQGAPNLLAYGASATPLPGEVDYDEKCQNWNRNIEMKIARHFYKPEKYQLDNDRTAAMVRIFCEDKSVHKILLEPHLKTRLGLGSFDKIRFQGCKAARHDDHIHVIW